MNRLGMNGMALFHTNNICPITKRDVALEKVIAGTAVRMGVEDTRVAKMTSKSISSLQEQTSFLLTRMAERFTGS